MARTILVLDSDLSDRNACIIMVILYIQLIVFNFFFSREQLFDQHTWCNLIMKPSERKCHLMVTYIEKIYSRSFFIGAEEKTTEKCLCSNYNIW